MHQNKDDALHCWNVQGTLCNHPLVERIEAESSDKDKCDYCIYRIDVLDSS